MLLSFSDWRSSSKFKEVCSTADEKGTSFSAKAIMLWKIPGPSGLLSSIVLKIKLDNYFRISPIWCAFSLKPLASDLSSLRTPAIKSLKPYIYAARSFDAVYTLWTLSSVRAVSSSTFWILLSIYVSMFSKSVCDCYIIGPTSLTMAFLTCAACS